MIRRWIERWTGHDRLLVAYEKVKRDNDDLTRKYEQLAKKHSNLLDTYHRTVEKAQVRRVELTRVTRRYTQALVDLQWERFLAAANDLGSDECVKIRLMDHDQAWDVADLLTERFGKSMYAYPCSRCPGNPITSERWWHVTRSRKRRRDSSSVRSNGET